jgi:hypothetical protein
MLKPVLGVAATGLAAMILWKLLVLFLLPLFGIALAVVFTVLKIADRGRGSFAIWLFGALAARRQASRELDFTVSPSRTPCRWCPLMASRQSPRW